MTEEALNRCRDRRARDHNPQSSRVRRHAPPSEAPVPDRWGAPPAHTPTRRARKCARPPAPVAPRSSRLERAEALEAPAWDALPPARRTEHGYVPPDRHALPCYEHRHRESLAGPAAEVRERKDRRKGPLARAAAPEIQTAPAPVGIRDWMSRLPPETGAARYAGKAALQKPRTAW